MNLSNRRQQGIMHILPILIFTIISIGLVVALRSVSEKQTIDGQAQVASGKQFYHLPNGAALPSASECTAKVRRYTWEPRPENNKANTTIPASGTYDSSKWDFGTANLNQLYRPLVKGNFTGTTDEIIQWGACKWGLDEDVTRARAVQESWWRQSTLGDFRTTNCNSRHPLGADGQADKCPTSFGLLQLKWDVHTGTWPASEDSTAFAVDYANAVQRACIEGSYTWLNQSSNNPNPSANPYPGYSEGADYVMWGCIGMWFSGSWYDSMAQTYISEVKKWLNNKEWCKSSFGSPTGEPCSSASPTPTPVRTNAPTPQPTVQATPSALSFTSTATITPTTVIGSGTVTVAAQVTSTAAFTGVAQVLVSNTVTGKVCQQDYTNQTFTANQAKTLTTTCQVSIAGTYVVRVGVFSANWATQHHWNNEAAQFSVVAPTPTPSPRPTNTPTPLPTPSNTPTLRPTNTPTPAPTMPATAWIGSYFTNRNLSGTPTLTRDEGATLSNNWRWGSVGNGIGRNNFSARYTKSAPFDTGVYTFTVRHDDGLRVLINGEVVYDRWADQVAMTQTFSYPMTQGQHTVIVEYYENRGRAQVAVSWQVL